MDINEKHIYSVQDPFRDRGLTKQKSSLIVNAAFQNLNLQQRFAEDIIESIPSLFYVLDENLKLIKWNRNPELFGYSRQELMGMDVVNELVPAEDRQYVLDRIADVFNKGRSNVYVRLKHKNGNMTWYFITGVRSYINSKYYQIGVGINYIEIEQAKEALREIHNWLDLAAESADAGFWAYDFKSNQFSMTDKWFELHGVAQTENMDFESLLGLIDPANRESLRNAVDSTIRTGKDLKMEYRVNLPSGESRWIDVRARMHVKPTGELDRLMGLSMDITERKSMEVELHERMKEVIGLKKQLEKENSYLREEVRNIFRQEEIIYESRVFKNLLTKAEQVAPTDTTVMILGETGTGKEVMARAIHNMSRRRERPLVTINCASLPPALIESELFGREKGAYTGAMTKMAGRFEAANGSTLFLDEIGELPLELQSKFLRAIELGRFERLGSTRSIQVDIRIIVATNRDLAREVREGRFRSDLYYRLNVFPIVIPPLRERKEDIPALVRGFVEKFQKKLGKRIESIPDKTMRALQSYSWPGNIRELRNVIEHAMIISDKTLTVQLPADIQEEPPGSGLKEMERQHILKVLEQTGWRIAGKHGAAEILGLKRTTLIYKLNILGIKRNP